MATKEYLRLSLIGLLAEIEEGDPLLQPVKDQAEAALNSREYTTSELVQWLDILLSVLDDFVVIDGDIYQVDRVIDFGYLPSLESGSMEWIVAEDEEHASRVTIQYWREMIENDPEEFRCIVGDEALIAWALGQSYAPGSIPCNSLEDWLQLAGEYPWEQWAGYDGEEREVDAISHNLITELGFKPTLAYRAN